MRANPADRIGHTERSKHAGPRARRKRKNNRRGKLSGLWRLLFISGLGFLGLSVLLVLPLRWIHPPTTMFMLFDTSDREPVLYRWMAWDQLGINAATAVVAAEDQNFPQHFGFDTKAIRQAVSARASGKRLRGASTLSQQVAKNLYLWPGKNFVRKGLEAWFTLLIEACWSKQRILEMHLNIAEYGAGIYGVPAASKMYFGKLPKQLTTNEAALLATVLPSPKKYSVSNPSSYVRKRQRWIMKHMGRLQRDGWLSLLD